MNQPKNDTRMQTAKKANNRQAGGTLLGLILGLIIGLSIAVVVAITIKNTPLPFTNKVGRPDKAPDATAAQPVDPNRALRGKEATRDAAPQAVKPAEQVPPAAETARDAAQAAREAAAVRGNKAQVVDKSGPADSVAKAEASSAADEKFTYYLQAGAFLEKADAENTRAKLALIGVSAGIAERKNDNVTLHRVRIGPFAQIEAMNRVRSKLTDNGIDVAVVRVPK